MVFLIRILDSFGINKEKYSANLDDLKKKKRARNLHLEQKRRHFLQIKTKKPEKQGEILSQFYLLKILNKYNKYHLMNTN